MDEKRILVVDDSPGAIDLVQRVLEHEGYIVDRCNSGKGAEDMARQAYAQNRPYEVIFMDIVMPEQDGITTAKNILNLNANHSPAILAYTASASRVDKSTVMASNCFSGYLTKPIDVDELPKLIEKYFN